MKPSLRSSPDHFIMHVGTNDLSPEKSSMETAESMINLACRLKNEMHDVRASTIILRTDDKKLSKKGMEVNLHLKELIKENNIFSIDSLRKIKVSRVLSNNFVNETSKVLH